MWWPHSIRRESLLKGRQGSSLIELMVVLATVGILSLIGLPRLEDFFFKSRVRSARTHVIGLYGKARANALQTARATTLNFSASTAWITAAPRLMAGAGTCDTIGNVDDLLASYGVTVVTTPQATFAIDPRGLGSSTGTVFVSGVGVTDSMVISGYGRVIK